MRLSITFFSLIFFVAQGFSQIKINVSEEQNSLSIGSVNTLCVTVYESSLDEVEKEWKKQLKDWNGNVKSKKEMFADDCLIKDMSDNTFDVYAILKEVDNGVKIIAAYDLGGAYLNSSDHKEYFEKLTGLMYDFAVKQTKAAIDEDLKNAENNLKDLEKAKDDLEKQNKDLEKEIEDMKQKIEDNKKDIASNKSSIETKKDEIETQKSIVKKIENKRDAVN